jgi:hypothetical protein
MLNEYPQGFVDSVMKPLRSNSPSFDIIWACEGQFLDRYCCNCLGESRRERRARSRIHKHIASVSQVRLCCDHILFYMSAFSTSCFVLCVRDGKFKQCVCIKFCMKICVSTTETLEMLCEAFGGHSLSWPVVFKWRSCFKAGRDGYHL